MGRLRTKAASPPETDPFAKPLSQGEIINRMEHVDNIVSEFKTFDDAVEYILAMDEEENRFFDPSGLLKEVNVALEVVKL